MDSCNSSFKYEHDDYRSEILSHQTEFDDLIRIYRRPIKGSRIPTANIKGTRTRHVMEIALSSIGFRSVYALIEVKLLIEITTWQVLWISYMYQIVAQSRVINANWYQYGFNVMNQSLVTLNHSLMKFKALRKAPWLKKDKQKISMKLKTSTEWRNWHYVT